MMAFETRHPERPPPMPPQLVSIQTPGRLRYLSGRRPGIDGGSGGCDWSGSSSPIALRNRGSTLRISQARKPPSVAIAIQRRINQISASVIWPNSSRIGRPTQLLESNPTGADDTALRAHTLEDLSKIGRREPLDRHFAGVAANDVPERRLRQMAGSLAFPFWLTRRNSLPVVRLAVRRSELRWGVRQRSPKLNFRPVVVALLALGFALKQLFDARGHTSKLEGLVNQANKQNNQLGGMLTRLETLSNS